MEYVSQFMPVILSNHYVSSVIYFNVIFIHFSDVFALVLLKISSGFKLFLTRCLMMNTVSYFTLVQYENMGYIRLLLANQIAHYSDKAILLS